VARADGRLTHDLNPQDQGPQDACGVFGVWAPGEEVAKLAYFGMYALQHRGQEAAGIAVSDGSSILVYKDLGLVSQVFDEATLATLKGHIALGHTRYSTTGSTTWENAQPVFRTTQTGTGIALGHNGNLVNATELREELAADGVKLVTTSDTEVIAALIANDPAPLDEAFTNAIARLEGAFSVTALAEGKLIGFRDPHGFRPLVLGRLDGDWVLASETCALDLVGAEVEREVGLG